MSERLLSATSTQVQKALKNGYIKQNPYILVRVFTDTTLPPTPSIAVVVSKKVIKTAVGRNKVKRQIRHILQDIELPKHTILVCIVKKGIETLPPHELHPFIESLVQSL